MAPSGVAGRIFDIQRFCLHDGGGIRTTVFLKGCPLECLWCHNPESQSCERERMFRAGRCMGCGACVAACERGALTLVGDRPRLDPAECRLDGACAAACPTGATELMGRSVGVAEVLGELRRDTAVFDESGGGATFSGGEPLAQADFLEAVLLACRAEGIHTTVDTSGYAPAAVMERIGPLADAFLFDVKHPDERVHVNLTGVSNAPILTNLEWLTGLRRARGAPDITIRVPLVAGVNDGVDVAMRLAMILASLDPAPPVDLLPYQPLGASKYVRLDRSNPLPDARAPSRDRLEIIRDVLNAAGLTVTIGGATDDDC